MTFLVIVLCRAGLTIVPVVPWQGPRSQGAPDQLPKFFYHAVFTLRLNVTTTKKVVNFLGEKSAPPEKILARRMRKWPRLTLVWGPRMINPALIR